MQPEDGYQDEICPELPRCAGQPRGIAIATDERRDAVHAAEGDLQKNLPGDSQVQTIRPSDADNPPSFPAMKPFCPSHATILKQSRPRLSG
jgi:hypothetical protein